MKECKKIKENGVKKWKILYMKVEGIGEKHDWKNNKQEKLLMEKFLFLSIMF